MWDIARPANDHRAGAAFQGGRLGPVNGHAIAREKDPIGHFSIGNTGIYDDHEMELVVYVSSDSGAVTLLTPF